MIPAAEMPPCPACGSTRFRYLFVKKERHFWRCEECHLERQFPLPTVAELKAYYDGAYVEGMYKTFTDADNLKQMTAAHRFQTIKAHCRQGKWLDVGASNGVFVAFARTNNIDAEGVELSEVAVSEARSEGIPVHCATIEDFDPGHAYDTITAFDTLEHVLDPSGFLNAVHRLLKPGGTLAITIPNQASIYRILMGRRWFHYIPEEHLFYFNPNSLKQLFSRAGLDTKMWCRAYKPVSFKYSLTQFEEYNPFIYRLLSPFSSVLGDRLGNLGIPVYMGEMLAIGYRHDNNR